MYYKREKKSTVKVLDNYHLEMSFNSSPTIFLHQLASPHAGIVKKVKNHDKSYSYIGSGPYTLLEREDRGAYVILSKNEKSAYENSHNNGLIIAYLDELNFQEQLLKYKLDGSLMYKTSTFNNVAHNNYSVVNDVAYITQTLVFNNKKFPFNNKIVRKALLSELYNNAKLEQCIDGGRKAYGFIPYGLGGSLSNSRPDKLPIINSEEIYDQVPILKNKPYDVYIHQHSGRKNKCEEEHLINAGKKYNINIHMVYEESYSSLFPKYFNHELDGFIELFVFTNREAYTKLLYFDPEDKQNFGNIEDAELQRQLKEALSNTSSSKRFLGYQQFTSRMNDMAYIVPFYYIGSSALVSKCIGGVVQEFYFNPFEHLIPVYHKEGCSL